MAVFVLLVLVAMIPLATSSNILMVLPLGSASHKNIFTPIAQKLGEKGHDVTLVSLHASTNKHSSLAYRDVVAESAWKKIQFATGDFNVFDMSRSSSDVNREIMKMMFRNLPDYCDAFLRDPAVQVAWNTKPDLIMIPAFMNECALAFVHKFQVPFIYVTTSGLTPWTADTIGNPEHPAYVPNQYLSYTDDMSLWERTVNTVMRTVSPLLRRHFLLRRLDGVVAKVLHTKSVSLEEIERNVSVVLVNSHHSLGFPRPLLPNVIEIGGMQCRPSKSLETVDPELNDFLDKAMERNVLFFSLGSHIKSSQMPEEVLSKFVNAFNKLPYDVVWKWEGTRPANLSSNVLTRKWLPQQDILGHSSVGAFLTHGGLLSLQETTYHGVPIVALPLMSDQFLNAKQAESLGMGRKLSLADISEGTIMEAVDDVMRNPSYRQEAEKRSQLLRDQETEPLSRAVYWTEYVIRHQGAHQLKSSVNKLSVVQYYLLDVIAVLVPIFFTSMALLLSIIIILVKLTFKLFAKFVDHKHSYSRL